MNQVVQVSTFSLLVSMISCAPLLIPDYIPKCYEPIDLKTADELSYCFMDHANKSRVFMATTGIPEVGIPSLDYVEIPKLEVEQVTRAYAIKLSMRNIGVRGLDQYITKNVKYHFHNYTFNGYIYLEEILLNGTYDVTGRIFEQNVTQTGHLEAKMSNVYLWVQFNYKVHYKNNVKYAKLLDFSTDFELGDVWAKIDNLFGENQVLNKATNEFINQSGKQLIEAAKPEVTGLVHRLASTIAKVLLDKIPYYSLFKERKKA